MPWSANDEEINGLIDSNLKSTPPNPPAVNTAETVRSLFKSFWSLVAAQVSSAIDYVDETNSSVFIQDAIAQTQGSVNAATVVLGQAQLERLASQTARDQAVSAKTDAQTLLTNAMLAQNPLGSYNVATNSPALTTTPPAGVNGSYYDITAAGNIAFAGSNFASGAALAIGGRLIKKDTQWYYQPPSDLALSKVTTLEALAAKSAELLISGVSIAFRDNAGNIIFAMYPDGSTYPPTFKAKILPFELSDKTLALIDKNKLVDTPGTNLISGTKDAAGNVVNGVLADGYPYPPTPTKRASTSSQKDLYFDDLYDYISPPKVIPNSIYGQWSWPVAVDDGECLYIGSVGAGKGGNQGEIKVSQKRRDGFVRSVILGNVRSDISYGPTDDHNVPVIRYDERAGAVNPITIYQTEHNTHPTRFFPQTSKNVFKWDKSFKTFGANASYTQVNVNGANKDEILIFSRLDSAIPRSWKFAQSTDNGLTWIEKPFFAGDGWMYMLGKNNADATKINITFYAHPDNSTDHRIFVMVLDWATGAIYAPGNAGSPICADFRAAMLDGSFTPIDPRVGALAIVTPPATTPELEIKTRIWDIGTSISGECLVTYNQFPKGKTMAIFNQSQHRVVSFNLDTGAINYDVLLRDAGMPMERRDDTPHWSYFSGNCVIDNKTVCLATYKNKSMMSGGTDVDASDGYTVLQTADLTNPGAVVLKELEKIPGKAGRPLKVEKSPYLLVINPSSFETFRTFQSCIHILNLNDYL